MVVINMLIKFVMLEVNAADPGANKRQDFLFRALPLEKLRIKNSESKENSTDMTDLTDVTHNTDRLLHDDGGDAQELCL